MDNTEQQETFSYSYSASEQADLRRLREKYTPKVVTEEEDKMEKLRRLDRSVTRRAKIFALTFGIIGTLILGAGMSLFMSEFGTVLGQYEEYAMAIGIVLDLVGAALASLAYPLYNAIVRSRREKLAPEILRLTDELLK